MVQPLLPLYQIYNDCSSLIYNQSIFPHLWVHIATVQVGGMCFIYTYYTCDWRLLDPGEIGQRCLQDTI